MDNYRIAFIYGSDGETKQITDGEIHLYGEASKDYLHTKYLLDYTKEYYPNTQIFKQLTIRHQREIIAYFLVKMGHIVFFNTTSNDEKAFKKYGKTGQFMFPDEITEKQQQALSRFAKMIQDYDIMISYNITLENGMMDSQTYQSTGNEEPESIINKYLMTCAEKSTLRK